MRIVLVISMIVTLFITPLCYASGFTDFGTAVNNNKKELGRPEMIVETATTIIVVFNQESSMKELRYNKVTDSYTVKEIYKLEDSTKSVWHKEPSERLQDGVNSYGKTN